MWSWVFALVLTLAAIGAARADSPPLVLEGPARDAALRGHLDALLEPGAALSPRDLVGPDAVAMTPVADPWADFGYVADRVWLRLRLVNATDRDDWRLHFRENFMQEFAVFAIRADGSVETLFETGRDSPFGARPIPYPEMVAPLRLASGEAATVLVRYRSDGSSHLALSVETLESFSEVATARTAKGYVFYGMVMLLIAVALIALALFRRGVFAAYAAYATAALLYIVHADGVAFQVLWPGWPGFNAMASVVTGTGIVVFGAVFARVFLQTRDRHPWLDRALLACIAVPLALDAALWHAAPQLLKKLLVIVSMGAILLFALSGIVAARTRLREVRFYVIAWLGVLASAALLNARHVLGIEISQDAQYDSMRAALVFDALMMGLAIADRYNATRRARQAAELDALRQARENAGLARRLAQLGERYERARALARGRGELLEDTVHDLRQPMQGLRLALDALTTGETGARGDEMRRFEASLDYMERLIEDRIDADATVVAPSPAATEPGRHGVYAVLRSVEAMFAPEADAKGLRLDLTLNAPDRPVHAFDLMRVMGNLVSNAVKFTRAGGVRITLDAEGDGLAITVRDTGPGLDARAFEAALARHVRIDATTGGAEGSGLGLAIAARIAHENDWSLALATDAPRARGAGIVLRLTSASASARPTRP